MNRSPFLFTLFLAILLVGLGSPAIADNTEMQTSGTVVSITSDRLVLDTADGERTFILSADPNRPAISVGENVTVTYSGEAGQQYASMVIPGTLESQQATTEPGYTATGERNRYEAAQPRPVAPETSTQSASIDAEDDDQIASTLPATSTSLPLLTLLSFAALALAAVARSVR